MKRLAQDPRATSGRAVSSPDTNGLGPFAIARGPGEQRCNREATKHRVGLILRSTPVDRACQGNNGCRTEGRKTLSCDKGPTEASAIPPGTLEESLRGVPRAGLVHTHVGQSRVWLALGSGE